MLKIQTFSPQKSILLTHTYNIHQKFIKVFCLYPGYLNCCHYKAQISNESDKSQLNNERKKVRVPWHPKQRKLKVLQKALPAPRDFRKKERNESIPAGTQKNSREDEKKPSQRITHLDAPSRAAPEEQSDKDGEQPPAIQNSVLLESRRVAGV